MSYNVRNAVVEEALQELGEYIHSKLPDDWGFTLMIFSIGEGGSMFYMSSAERTTMIEAMKEFIKRNEM